MQPDGLPGLVLPGILIELLGVRDVQVVADEGIHLAQPVVLFAGVDEQRD